MSELVRVALRKGAAGLLRASEGYGTECDPNADTVIAEVSTLLGAIRRGAPTAEIRNLVRELERSMDALDKCLRRLEVEKYF
jgi:hypothetical protein